MSEEKRDALAEEAVRLHKAWFVCLAIHGDRSMSMLHIPAYLRWEIKKLKRQVDALRQDLLEVGKRVVLDEKRLLDKAAIEWLCRAFDDWHQAGCGNHCLGTVLEVERALGKLAFRRTVDCPPYAEVILQGLFGGAVRHPEYHLAMDLALLYNCFLDMEALIERSVSKGVFANSEPSQSLGRSVILTCFNLLESFVSGLAVGYLMQNPSAPPDVVKKLKDREPLRKRFKTFPGLVSGRGTVLDDLVDPLLTLLGDCKQRRDSFVHCEPGPAPSGWGYVKQAHFHDITIPIVRRTVDLTEEAICLACAEATGRQRPTWLKVRGEDGRFPQVSITVADRMGEE